jgi:hypothetical protein
MDSHKSTTGKKLARSVHLRRSFGGSSVRLAPISNQAYEEVIGSPQFGEKVMELATFSKQTKDAEEVMYDAVVEHYMEEDEEDGLPDTLVSRLTKVIHDQKCVGPGTSALTQSVIGRKQLKRVENNIMA